MKNEKHELLKKAYDIYILENHGISDEFTLENYPIERNDDYKLFHSKENALKWIKEQNKPIEIELDLYHGFTAKVDKYKIIVKSTKCKSWLTLSHSDLENLQNAVKQISK